MLDPVELLRLKETGNCEFRVPEALFDLDHPGHYLRRLKLVSLTLPCVTGPYTQVNCSLTLESSVVCMVANFNDAVGTDYEPVQAMIVTSSGQNDSGLFEAAMRDERYLLFEGAGAVSTWKLELPNEFRLFDYDTISDVILHLRYTARDGSGVIDGDGKTFKDQVIAKLQIDLRNASASGLTALFSAKRDLPNAWHNFLHPLSTEPIHRLQIDLSNRFNYVFKQNIEINKIRVFFVPKDTKLYQADPPRWQPIPFGLEKEAEPPVSLVSGRWELPAEPLSKLPPYAELAVSNEKPARWQLTVDGAAVMAPLDKLWSDVEGATFKHLKAEAVEDIILIFDYHLATTT